MTMALAAASGRFAVAGLPAVIVRGQAFHIEVNSFV